ncbi:unnamed protein product [Macrosiphum euphorbiae]|uniref:Uncharacterized protein n=1 Tax=Macrosiphum euphorbiae TaxID=13131 RepID=A0AAV0X365_9HEMI|nr:unnamed protein product [Macrosiphum euphorbiae]
MGAGRLQQSAAGTWWCGSCSGDARTATAVVVAGATTDTGMAGGGYGTTTGAWTAVDVVGRPPPHDGDAWTTRGDYEDFFVREYIIIYLLENSLSHVRRNNIVVGTYCETGVVLQAHAAGKKHARAIGRTCTYCSVASHNIVALDRLCCFRPAAAERKSHRYDTILGGLLLSFDGRRLVGVAGGGGRQLITGDN